jgi:hypothetical protein
VKFGVSWVQLARAVEDSGLKLVWVKLDVLGDEIAHVVLRDESEVNRKQCQRVFLDFRAEIACFSSL